MKIIKRPKPFGKKDSYSELKEKVLSMKPDEVIEFEINEVKCRTLSAYLEKINIELSIKLKRMTDADNKKIYVYKEHETVANEESTKRSGDDDGKTRGTHKTAKTKSR